MLCWDSRGLSLKAFWLVNVSTSFDFLLVKLAYVKYNAYIRYIEQINIFHGENEQGSMMTEALVLINAEMGSETEILKSLRKVEGVVDAFIVYGVYDIVSKVKAENMDHLKGIIVERIRNIDKVRSTLTLIVDETTK